MSLLRASADTVHMYFGCYKCDIFMYFVLISKPCLIIMWFVYILRCSDNSRYTGCTNNLENRVVRHGKGQIHYTRDKLPVKLISYTAFTDKYKAYSFERYLKSGSGMAFRNKRLI